MQIPVPGVKTVTRYFYENVIKKNRNIMKVVDPKRSDVYPTVARQCACTKHAL